MKGSFVLLSSLLSIAASQCPPGGWGPNCWKHLHGHHKQIPFNRGVAVTTWCDHFHEGTDASGGCGDNGKDIVYDEPEDAKAYCKPNPECIGVTKHHDNGKFTPRCGNMYPKDIVLDNVSWLNKDGCDNWCDNFQQKKDASGGCDNGRDIVYDDSEDAKSYCDLNKQCIGVTQHPTVPPKFTPRCGDMEPEETVSDTVFWLNKDGCL